MRDQIRVGCTEKVAFTLGIDDWVGGSTGGIGGKTCRPRGLSEGHVGKMGGKLDDIA